MLKLFSPRFSFGEQSIHDLQIVWVITNVLLRGRTLDLLSQILCLSVLRAKIRRAHENHCAFHAGEEVQPDGLGVAAQRSMQKDHDQRSWSQWNDDAALTAEAEGRLARRVHGWEQTRTEVLGRYAITLLPSGPPRQLQSAARVSEERVISNDRSTST